MTSARHLVEVMSQVGGCDQLIDGLDYYPKVDSHFSRRMLERRQTILAKTIETEIIPRLMLAHRETAEKAPSKSKRKRKSFDGHDVSEFARLVVVHDVSVADANVKSMIDQGASLEDVFTQLFSASARHLGDLWLADKCNFSDVTIGLSRIQQLVHAFSPFFEAEGDAKPSSGRCALILPLPGEQHSLGVLIVEEFFRRAGWDVWAPLGINQADLLQLVSQERFDVVGFSVSGEGLLDRIASGIHDVRKASINPHVVVMVGGRFFNEHPEYVAKVGADVTDLDGSQAVTRLEGFSHRLRSV